MQGLFLMHLQANQENIFGEIFYFSSKFVPHSTGHNNERMSKSGNKEGSYGY